MGKPKAPPPAYRDDATLEDAVSLHTTQGDEDIATDLETLPAYTDDDGQESAPLLSDVETIQPYKVYPEMHAFMDARFDSDPVYAEQTVKKWATIPPAQMIRIVGTHKETTKNGKKEETNTVTDFDVQLRLTEYLPINHNGNSPWVEMRTVENTEKTYRGTVFKTRAKGKQGDVEEDIPKSQMNEWCHLYCASHSRLKTFSLTRQVTGLDSAYLHEALKSLVLRTNYKGRVNITFPMSNQTSQLYSTNWQNRWRLTQWICMLFYISLLFIFTWPYLYFFTKKWAVIKVDWAYSKTDAQGRKTYATISERKWFDIWKGCIEKSVLSKKQGLLTEDDLQAASAPEQEFRSGHEGLDTAVGFLGAGLQAYNHVNRQLGWGGDC